jgi:hypothetical protein
MNLKATYHYTYFIHPFLVTESMYKDFINKFLKDDKNWSLIIHDNAVDLNTHAYFLPYVKKFLFPTLYWKAGFKNQFDQMPYKKRLDILSKLSSVSFEYIIEKEHSNNYQSSDKEIGFDITRIKLICFEPGICFFVIKAELDRENGLNSNDILDFNYRFRTVNPRYLKKKKTEGMHLKNLDFSSTGDFSSFIDNLLYGFEDVEKENIYFDRLFTYSFMCLDGNEWNEDRDLDEIINEFYKFQYILPSDYGSTFDPDFKGIKDNTYTRWKYSIYGFSRESGVVFASERERFNSTKLPQYYESMYFYIFLLAFYQRISLILFSQELMNSGKKKIEDLKHRFTKFTHFSWFSQITNSEQGMDLWKKWQKSFDLPSLFDEVQKEYSEYYEFIVARGQERINLLLIIIYTISVLFSGMQLMYYFNIIDHDSYAVKVVTVVMVALTILAYPLYVVIRGIRRWVWKRSDRHNA